MTSQHGAVYLNENQQHRATSKLIFERLRDRMEVRFSLLFFILIDLCENVIHEKLSIAPLLCSFFFNNVASPLYIFHFSSSLAF